jgi:hypothetical protein
MTNTSIYRVAIPLLITLSITITTYSTLAEDLPVAETANFLEFLFPYIQQMSISFFIY